MGRTMNPLRYWYPSCRGTGTVSSTRSIWPSRARRPAIHLHNQVAVCLSGAQLAYPSEELVMAMPRKVPVDFGVVFPYGAYAVGEVTQVKDYDRSTREV